MRKLLIETTPLNSEDYDAINSLDNSSSTDDESNRSRGCAGTDHPWYEDGNGFEISGSYDDDDAVPFGYWPINPKTRELRFFIYVNEYGDDYGAVHNDIFADALYDYIYNFIFETFEPVEDELCEKMKAFYDFTQANGLKHKERQYGYDRVCVFEDKNGGNRIIFKDVVSETFKELGITIPVCERLAKLIYKVFDEAYWDLSDFCNEFIDEFTCDLDFRDDYDQNYACETFNLNSSDIFNEGRLEGRIWFDTGLITFYPGQQPSRDEMKQVIKDIAENEGKPESDFYGFYTIFEVGSKDPYTGSGYKIHYDAKIQCCTVADYIEGKYSGFNREDEIEMVKNRKGANKMIHLANQKDKFNFFKNFRKTRDNAVYVPREKGAGTLAAYHAMRYPFGENRVIKEDYRYTNSNNAEAGTDWPFFYDEKRGKEFGGDWRSPIAYPFAYFETSKGNLEFFVGEGYSTHSGLAFKVAKDYYLPEETFDKMTELSEAIVEKINNLVGPAINGDEERREWLRDNFYDICEKVFYESSANKYTYSSLVIKNVIGDTIRLSLEINHTYDPLHLKSDLYNAIEEDCIDNEEIDNDDPRVYYLDQLFQFTDLMDGDEYFENGRMEGRIFTGGKTISFYDEQQPNSEELDEIIKNLAKEPKLNVSYDELMEYEIIYRNWDKTYEDEDGYDRGIITGCSVYEYITGKPMDEFINPEERKGSQFVPHLASPEEKFNFFKNFRDTRDRAVYVPREKGAGTLAAYHAMRYPYGESRKSNGKLLTEEHYNQAGTDFPCFYDENTGEWYEASWNADYGFPFGYWPIDDAGNEGFFCAAPYETHAQACGKAAKEYFETKLNDIAYESANEINTALREFIDYFNDNEFYYDEIEDVYVSEELNETKSVDDFIEMVRDNVYLSLDDGYEYISQLVTEWLEDDIEPNYDRIAEHLTRLMDDKHSFGTREEIDESLEVIGSNFDDFFQSGHGEGRIWPYDEIISFYETEQPSPRELEVTLKNLADYMDISVEDYMDYTIIFEDPRNNWEVTACTISNYIDGNYGPDEEKDDEEDEEEMQYARDGKTVFVPHLANQQDKFNFFKAFRDTRDRAVYTPREKAAGSLAAYHAMRYPYVENRKRFLQMIDEEVDLLLEGNGSRAKRQTIGVIADRFGFDVDSPYAIDMENKFKTMFFHHGLDNDRYIVFEPNLCRCALDLGFGTNDFSVEDKNYISDAFNFIYKYIDPIQDVPTRQSELKRIKDAITDINALRNVVNELQSNLKATEDEERKSNDEEKVTQLKNGYTVIGPVDYETAHEYGNYSNPKGRLCFSQQPGTWKNTYSKNGINTCYILLKDGWKDIPAEHDGSNAYPPYSGYTGYDNYGMSMIFIFVNPQGHLAFANGRWNHNATWPSGLRCDNEFTEQDITNIIGVPFDRVFKSAYNFDELLAKALEKVKNGVPLSQSFDNAIKFWDDDHPNEYKVVLGGMENIFYNDRVISPIWFDNVESFDKFGIANGKLGSTIYLFDTKGKTHKFSEISQVINAKLANGESLSNIGINYRIRNNYALISMYHKNNVISLKNNKIVSPNIWFDGVSVSDNLICGEIGEKKYYLFEDGKIVSEEKILKNILDNIENYPNLFQHQYDVNQETNCVKILGKYYYIRKSDKSLVTNKGFYNIAKQSNSRFVWGYEYRQDENEKYAIDLKTGDIIPESEFYTYIWRLSGVNTDGAEEIYYQKIEPAGEGIYRAYFIGKGWNYIKDGKIMFNTWFKECSGFENGIAKVYDSRNWGWRIINTNGEFLTKEGYENLDIYGKYIIGYDEEENEDYDGENDEYINYFTIIDLSTGEKIYDHAKFDDERVLDHTTLGEYFISDGDEIDVVFTKDGQMLNESEYSKLLSETYKRTKDLSLFSNVEDIDYGYKKVKAAYYDFNILDREGNLVLNKWAWWLDNFSDKRLKVKGENYLNYLDENLKPILPNNNNFIYGDNFKCGFARVRGNNYREYFIDVNGNIAFDKNGYKYCCSFDPVTRLAKVVIDGAYYDLATDGSLRKSNN